MTDNNAPLYDRIPNADDPNSRAPEVNGHYQNAKNAAVNNAQSAMGSIQNHPLTKSVKDTVHNGPVAQQVKSEFANTQAEFQNLANSRTRPSHTAATGQQLTHYHSLFYNLLSWKNPRATTIAYLTTLALIFAGRYLPVVRYLFKSIYLTLGVTAAAEVVGKLVFGNGLTSQVRPRRYYTLPKESVDRVMDDLHELLNFFVIESQRLLFAENVGFTIAAFLAALLSYFLIKFVPLWGLALIGTSVLYLAPLVYLSNKELIDNQLNHLSNILNQQAHQVKDLTVHHTTRATETVKHYAGDYSAKAQEYIVHAKNRTASITKDYSAKTQTNLASAKDRTASAAQDYSAKAQDNLYAAKDRTASAAQDYSARAQDSAVNAKDRTVSAAQDATVRAQDSATAAKDRTASAAHDYSAQAQDSAVSAKDRTASAANDASATSQDYLGAAKDRAAHAKDALLSYLPGQNQQGPTEITTDVADGSASYQPSDFPAAPAHPVAGPTHPIADEFSAPEPNPRVDGEPLYAS